MRVAFLSDIHANFPALIRALDSAKRRGADQVIIAGDLVGGGPHPLEVIRLLRDRGCFAILGNVERKLLERGRDPKVLARMARKKGKANLAWTALQLGAEEWAWLEGLPTQHTTTLADRTVLVVHGSPRADTDYLFPSLTAAALRRWLGDANPDILVCGHSHIPFTRAIDGVRVVNCGSVGRPVDGDPRGSYALVDCESHRAPTARIVRFNYPVAHALADLRARRVPGAVPSEVAAGIKRKGS